MQVSRLYQLVAYSQLYIACFCCEWNAVMREVRGRACGVIAYPQPVHCSSMSRCRFSCRTYERFSRDGRRIVGRRQPESDETWVRRHSGLIEQLTYTMLSCCLAAAHPKAEAGRERCGRPDRRPTQKRKFKSGMISVLRNDQHHAQGAYQRATAGVASTRQDVGASFPPSLRAAEVLKMYVRVISWRDAVFT